MRKHGFKMPDQNRGGWKPVLIGVIVFVFLTAAAATVFALLLNNGTVAAEDFGWIRTVSLCLSMPAGCLVTGLLCRRRLAQSAAAAAVLELGCLLLSGYLLTGSVSFRPDAVAICAGAAVLAILIGMKRQRAA